MQVLFDEMLKQNEGGDDKQKLGHRADVSFYLILSLPLFSGSASDDTRIVSNSASFFFFFFYPLSTATRMAQKKIAMICTEPSVLSFSSIDICANFCYVEYSIIL